MGSYYCNHYLRSDCNNRFPNTERPAKLSLPDSLSSLFRDLQKPTRFGGGGG